MVTLLATNLAACSSNFCCRDKDGSFKYRADGKQGRLELLHLEDSLNVIIHICGKDTLDRWEIKHPVYRFECGDLTGDNLPEIAVGVEKRTKYHKENGKRLFIFHLYNGRLIRPLWLGSRVGAPLADFEMDRSSEPARIHTWEVLEDGSQIQRLYTYNGFGLKYYKTL